MSTPTNCSSVVKALCPVVLGVCLFFGGTVGVRAQSTEGPQEATAVGAAPGPWVPSFRTLGQNAVSIVWAPAELSPTEGLLTLGMSGLVLSAVSAADRPVYRHLSAETGRPAQITGPLAGPGRLYDRVGPDRFALGTASLLALGGAVLERRRLTRTSVHVVEAVLYTKVITGLAKGFFSRSRPFVGDGPFSLRPAEFDGHHTATSMPSGHTSRAFAIASVLAHQADRWYVSVLTYGGAASVGLERVRSGDHWLTDVVVGATLGYLIGRAVTPSAEPSGTFTYEPIVSTRRVGLSVRF